MPSTLLAVNKKYFSGKKHQQRNQSDLVWSQVSHHSLIHSKQHQLLHQHTSKLHKIIVPKGLMPSNIMLFCTRLLFPLALSGIQYCLTVLYLVFLFFFFSTLQSSFRCVYWVLKNHQFPPSGVFLVWFGFLLCLGFFAFFFFFLCVCVPGMFFSVPHGAGSTIITIISPLK